MKNNRVQNEEGRVWFPYFRFYSLWKEVVDLNWLL